MDHFLDCQVGGGIYEMIPDEYKSCDEVMRKWGNGAMRIASYVFRVKNLYMPE